MYIASVVAAMVVKMMLQMNMKVERSWTDMSGHETASIKSGRGRYSIGRGEMEIYIHTQIWQWQSGHEPSTNKQ